MTILSTTIAFLLFVLVLALHEAAHAYALHGLGYRIKAAGLGLPIAPRLKFKPTARRPFSISISPWLVGAYVQVHNEDEEAVGRLRYWDQAWFSGAGVVANLSVGGILVALVLAIQGRFWMALAWAAVGVMIWLRGRLITALIVPIVALAVFVGSIYLVITTTASLVSGTGNPQMGGILGIGGFLVVDSPLDALKVAALLSISLGLANMLPLAPFDGGRICAELVRRWWGETAQRVYVASSLALGFGLILYMQVLDIAIMINR